MGPLRLPFFDDRFDNAGPDAFDPGHGKADPLLALPAKVCACFIDIGRQDRQCPSTGIRG